VSTTVVAALDAHLGRAGRIRRGEASSQAFSAFN